MLRDLKAAAELRGERIDVSWRWTGMEARPAFRLLRRRRAYPEGPGDGLAVVDLGELLRGPEEPWDRVVRVRYLVLNSPAEGGLVQAAVRVYHAAPDDAGPTRVDIEYLDQPGGEMVVERFDDVTRLVRTLPAPGSWGQVETLDVFHAPGGGAEAFAGVVTISRDHSDGVTPPRFEWAAAGEAPVELEFDRGEATLSEARVHTADTTAFHASCTRVIRADGWDLGAALSPLAPAAMGDHRRELALTLEERFSEDTGEWTRDLRVSDEGAATEEPSYYALFLPDGAAPGGWATDRDWRARATATARYGLSERLYGLLPALHQYYDEPTTDRRGQGQLRRFMQVFGAALDHLRSTGEALRTRHDAHQVRDDFLLPLGEWIGWPTDRTAPVPAQRNDIRFAPELYRTVGTLPNLTALVSRVTGWECRAKEFAHNVLLTNAPETVPLWELWESTHDGTDFSVPERAVAADGFDGRPAAVLDSGGDLWLFWHSDRSGRRELWVQRLDGVDPAPVRLMEGTDDDGPALTHSDLWPAALLDGADVWLFWESDREGRWDIWSRRLSGLPAGAPERITDHPAADRRPAVAREAGGDIWVFWESGRRGPTDIWARVHDGATWGPPTRLSEAPARDGEPSAATDAAGRLWLVWRRDEGDRTRLYARVREAGTWGDAAPLDEGGPHRDEAPSLVQRGPDLWLLWHSNRTGHWELWGRVHDGADWGEPFRVTRSPEPDKEAAAVVQGGDLRLFWRSRRRAMEVRSRTVDTSDAVLLAGMGAFADRLHYTYDTARSNEDRYSRDAVGLFLETDGESPEEVARKVARARTYVDPFRPVTIRLVWVPDVPLLFDPIDVDDLLTDEFEDEVE